VKYNKISKYKIRKILQCFANELTATQAAKMVGVNQNTAERYYNIFREKIAEYQEEHLQKFRGEIEIDESYFGSRHNHDPRGRSTKRKIPVIGLLKRNGKVYTEILSDASHWSIMPIIERLVQKSKTNIYTDKWKSYDSWVTTGYKHHRINHSKPQVHPLPQKS